MLALRFLSIFIPCLPGIFALPMNSTIKTRGSGDVVMSSWYPSWLGSRVPLEKISWSKYNHMAYSFGIPTADPSVISLDSDSEKLLPSFVSEAKKNNVRALLSLGGWSGSQYFSSSVATDSTRTAFVNAIIGLVQKYNLDGIDFDWEYPGIQGSGLNGVSSDDSGNFLTMLQQLRQTDVGRHLIISAAVTLTPFAGVDGQPMTDVSAFADVINYIEIMAYDIWGSWSPVVGPNAPLYDNCALKQAGSVESAVQNWSAAGFPMNQIVIGVASYGRGYTVSANAANEIGNFPPFDSSQIPAGDSDSSTTASPSNSGLFDFATLIKNGYLTETGNVSPGITYKFDDCSQTPYLYKSDSGVIISYDDSRSFAAKGQYIKNRSLGGLAMWHAIGDSHDILLNSGSNAML